VKRIATAHAASVTSVLEELLMSAKAGELVSLAYMVEHANQREPIIGIEGRLREDIPRLIGELSIMKDQLALHKAQTRGWGCLNF
jgi:hypothetical protein